MFASFVLYAGLVLAFFGLILTIKPIRRLGIRKRTQGLLIILAGIAVSVIGLFLPTSESRVSQVQTQLDSFMPAWQFNEVHSIRIAAPPSRVFEAIMQVRADEIALFKALTWIRRGGRDAPESLLNPGNKPIMEVATESGFIYLADIPLKEIVLGTAVVVPPNTPIRLTPEIFEQELPPGFALAAMNFSVRPDSNGSILTTETRIFANNASAKRSFAKYWRVIYPGSALIRRMWLRAIENRALAVPP